MLLIFTICFCLISLQVKNKPHDEGTNTFSFILELGAATNNYYASSKLFKNNINNIIYDHRTE
jgi:hypothetical protein